MNEMLNVWMETFELLRRLCKMNSTSILFAMETWHWRSNYNEYCLFIFNAEAEGKLNFVANENPDVRKKGEAAFASEKDVDLTFCRQFFLAK